MPDSPPISLAGSLWMTIAGQNFGGAQRISLLQQIAAYGSITQAAKALNISYKAAWDALDAMNNLAGEPLLERSTGGKGGGGSRLTARGQQLVDNFQRLDRLHQDFIAQLSQQAAHLADDLLLLRNLQMKISARNQFAARVRRIHAGAVNDDIELELTSGTRLLAQITRESTAELALAPGIELVALIKASSIMLVTGDIQSDQFSTPNQLSGQIVRIQPGAVNTEIVLDLGQSNRLAAIIPQDSAEQMGLREGQQVSALIQAADILLARNL